MTTFILFAVQWTKILWTD